MKPTKKAKRNAPRKRGTGVPLPGIEAAMNARGYVSPTQAATLAGTARSTVYGWMAREGALRDPEGTLPTVVKEGAFKWILRRAVEAMAKPVEVVDAAIAAAARPSA